MTTPAKTIADLKGSVSPAQWRRAIRQAGVHGLTTGIEEPGDRTKSELEHLFLRLCRRHRLPMPEVNVWVGPHEVDFLWREQRLIVETDGYRYHRGPAAFESDRRRDLHLQTQGYEVRRLTYRQITSEPQRVATSIAKSLQA